MMKVLWRKGEDPFDGSPRYSVEGRDPCDTLERVTCVIVTDREEPFRCAGYKVNIYTAEVYDREKECCDEKRFRKVAEAKVWAEAMLGEYLQAGG